MDAAPQAVLQWDRGALEAECDRAAVVRAGVEAYLGRAAFGAEGGVVVRVRLSRIHEQNGARVVAQVTQEDASGKQWGERSVVGDESCASLDEPLTLVVALLVDAPPEPAEAVTPPEPPAPVAEPAKPTPPEPDEPVEIATAPSLERSLVAPAHSAWLGLGLVAMGALPSAGFGAGLVASLKPRGFWGFGVEAGGLVSERKRLASGSLEASLLVLRVSVCPLQGIAGEAWWSACGSFGAARLRLESHGLLEARARSEWIAMPSLSARAAWLVSKPWALVGGLEAAFPVSPDRYVYRDREGARQTAFEMNPLLLTANLGVGVILN